MAAAAELRPNPDGCTEFEINPFKKEKCKHCGRHWQEHQGVISDELVQGYLKDKRAVAERKQAEEDEAKEKARAKALAKKKLARAVEDDWFFDESKEDGLESEDDGLGFQMFEGGDIKSKATASSCKAPAAQEARPLRVVNLIDFGECDVAEDMPAPPPAAPPVPAVEAAPPLADEGFVRGADNGFAIGSASSSTAAPVLAGPTDAALGQVPEDDLFAEIQHLRQRLMDSDAERDVQVSIVQDEVAEKQRVIEELTRQREEAEAALARALDQVESLRQEKERVASSRKVEENEPLRPSQIREPDELPRDQESYSAEVALDRQGTETSSLAWKVLDHRTWLRCLRPPE